MGSGMDFLSPMNFTCLDCQDLGPPPDSILAIPPPPLPAFLLRTPSPAPANTSTTCGAVCDWTSNHAEFIELPIHEDGEFLDPHEGPSGKHFGTPLDDTWLLVLVTSSIGVLVIAVLLALFLVKLKQERGSKAKVALQMDQGPPPPKNCEAVLYPGPDNRVLWATLTPRGTSHQVIPPTKSFDNSGFVDPDDYIRIRPKVSSPTRIEHPNLPPLNLHRPCPVRREPSDTAPIV